MGDQSTNSAKFTFFYLISLISLIFLSISTGNIIFQMINKYVVDVIYTYSGEYSASSLKFAIASLIISAPIYYLSVKQINNNLFSGKLPHNHGIRRWLTYLILLISSIIAIGWLIAILYSFLDGDLTLKFALKTLTALSLSSIVASYYFFDIRHEEIKNDKHEKIIKNYFYSTSTLIIIILISGFIFAESPKETRKRKMDNLILEKFDNIDYALNDYYIDNNKLPENLNILTKDMLYLIDDDIQYIQSDKIIEYKILADKQYSLCAEFNFDNINTNNQDYSYFENDWPHKAGYQCLSKKVRDKDGATLPPIREVY